MTHAIHCAINQGIDAARIAGKDADSPYHNCHPMFRYWWEALVMKYDDRDKSESCVRKAVLQRVKVK